MCLRCKLGILEVFEWIEIGSSQVAILITHTDEEVSTLDESFQLGLNDVLYRVKIILEVEIFLLSFSLNFLDDFAVVTLFVWECLLPLCLDHTT